MTDLFDLAGSVSLCTGASSGIGQHMSTVLANAGSDVVLVGRKEKPLQDTAEQINSDGKGKAQYIVADLLDRAGLPSLVEKASDFFGDPDILINAAGINLRQPYDEVTLESWDETLNLNLSTPFFLARACLPGMMKNNYGKIINIASLQSFRAFANSIPYGASKGGIVQLTRAMSEAWSQHGIMTNAIAPGFFPSYLTQKVFNDPVIREHNAKMTAIGRNGELQDLDGITIFLASKASHYITGQTISLDGGFTAK